MNPGHIFPAGPATTPASTTNQRQPARRRSLIVRLAVTAIILSVLGGLLYGFNRFRTQAIADFFAHNRPPPIPVALANVAIQPMPRYLNAIGTLVAVRQVVVTPEVAGRIMRIFFESGAVVRADDPLVQLNDATEQADLLAQRAQIRLAELNLERYRDLRRSQATPQSTVDQYQAQLDELSANASRTQALIAQKLIRAPFAGDLGIRQVDAGGYVTAGASIVTLTDLSRLYVNFTLPEQTLSDLSIGQKALIASDTAPGRDFEAVVTTIEPQVSADLRAIKVQAILDNAERRLRPGMFANVRVALPPQPDALTIPETAVDYTVYGDSVFVAEDGKGPDGKDGLVVQRVPVKVGDRGPDRVEILSGLKRGDRIVVSGQLKLSNGAAVVPVDDTPLAPPATLPQN